MTDLINLVLIFALFVLFGFWLSTRWYTFWSRKGVTQLEPRFIYGDMNCSELHGETYKKIYDEFKRRGVKYGGVYTFLRRDFFPVDTELIKTIMQKDFMYFQSNGSFIHEKDVLSQQLLNMWGDKWKSMRSSLTPAFSSGKIKFMFDTMLQKTDNLSRQALKIADSCKPADVKDLMARYTTDVIVTAAFGIECDALESPEKNSFRKVSDELFKLSFWNWFGIFFLEKILPWSILGNLGYKSLGTQDMEDFFVDLVKQLSQSRKKDNVERKDFFDFLVKLKNKDFHLSSSSNKKGPDGLTDAEMAAQSFLFYVGGFETTSTTLAFAFLHAALHPEYQAKCRKEIREVLEKHSGKFTYEAAQDMVYVDQFIHETLRMTPPFLDLLRECTKDYHLANSDVIIKKGTKVVIPIWGVHMDPDIYPNPTVFNPDNFAKEIKQTRPDCSFLPFGDGPRMCLGLRFGLINVRIAFARLLNEFEVKLNSKTRVPIIIDPNEIVTTAKGGIWLDFVKLD